MAAASRGLDWHYPCLIWVADYVLAATGSDPAADWRAIAWDEARAKGELELLAGDGIGVNAVSRAMDAMARRMGWVEADAPQQGAIMIGVYGVGDEAAPAIYDGQRRWIVSIDGRGWRATLARPARMWIVA